MAELLPDGYAEALQAAKTAIGAARTRAVLAVNRELLQLYWTLGRLILERQQTEGWGTRVINRLSADLQREFPGMTGLSPRNLMYMRQLAASWPDGPIAPQLVAQLPWGHNRELLDRLEDPEFRAWYAAEAIQHGWSRAVLVNQIMSQLHLRAGGAPSNFAELLPSGDSELVQQMTKDPYNLEFLTLERDAAEREMEAALVAHVQEFLLELGHGFAFVGRQYRLDVDGDEFFVDLLMFHIPSARYVVIELKTTKLTPPDVGQLNFYVAVVDDQLRLPAQADTIGLLLCSTRNEQVVRYALGRSTSPLAVAGYRYTELGAAERAILPAEEELAHVVAEAIDEFEQHAESD